MQLGKRIEVRGNKMNLTITEIELDIIGTFSFAQKKGEFSHVGLRVYYRRFDKTRG